MSKRRSIGDSHRVEVSEKYPAVLISYHIQEYPIQSCKGGKPVGAMGHIFFERSRSTSVLFKSQPSLHVFLFFLYEFAH